MSAESEKELSDLERALGKLVPQPSHVVRDRILFAAGEMRARRVTRLLAACIVALVGLSAFLSYQLWVRPLPSPEVRIVTMYPPDTTPVEPPTPKKDVPESIELTVPPLPPVLSGDHPSHYGAIQRNIPHFGEGALRPGSPVVDSPFAETAPTRIGSRPGASESLLPWFFRR